LANWPSESLFQKPPASEAAAVGRQHFAHGVLKFASGRDGRDAPLDLHVPLLRGGCKGLKLHRWAVDSKRLEIEFLERPVTFLSQLEWGTRSERIKGAGAV